MMDLLPCPTQARTRGGCRETEQKRAGPSGPRDARRRPGPATTVTPEAKPPRARRKSSSWRSGKARVPGRGWGRGHRKRFVRRVRSTILGRQPSERVTETMPAAGPGRSVRRLNGEATGDLHGRHHRFRPGFGWCPGQRCPSGAAGRSGGRMKTRPLPGHPVLLLDAPASLPLPVGAAGAAGGHGSSPATTPIASTTPCPGSASAAATAWPTRRPVPGATPARPSAWSVRRSPRPATTAESCGSTGTWPRGGCHRWPPRSSTPCSPTISAPATATARWRRWTSSTTGP